MTKPYLDWNNPDAARQRLTEISRSLGETIARLEALEAKVQALEAPKRVVNAKTRIPVFPVGWDYDDTKGWSRSPEGTP